MRRPIWQSAVVHMVNLYLNVYLPHYHGISFKFIIFHFHLHLSVLYIWSQYTHRLHFTVTSISDKGRTFRNRGSLAAPPPMFLHHFLVVHSSPTHFVPCTHTSTVQLAPVSRPNSDSRSDLVGLHLLCDQWAFAPLRVCSWGDL